MTGQPIQAIKKIKLYYPYLMDRKTPLELHQSYIISYLLLAHKVLLPPDHIFNPNVAKANLKWVGKNSLFFDLFLNGYVITTITDKKIRDTKDLIEQRSHKKMKLPGFSLPLYYRDGKYQRDQYTVFILEELQKLKQYAFEKEKFNKLVEYIKTWPSNEEIVAKVESLRFCHLDDELVKSIKALLRVAYLKGGVDGNHAVMPTFGANAGYSFFNGLYDYRFAAHLRERCSKLLKRDIESLAFPAFSSFIDSLSQFKEYYYARSLWLRDFDTTVLRRLRKTSASSVAKEIGQVATKLMYDLIGEFLEAKFGKFLGEGETPEILASVTIGMIYEKVVGPIEKLVRSLSRQLVPSERRIITDALNELILRYDHALALSRDDYDL